MTAPAFASCPTCRTSVVTSKATCPWCDGDVTPPDDDAYSMQRATEVTYLAQLATVKR